MPAKSKKQQILSAIALSAKRGKTPKSKLRGSAKQMLNMSEDELRKFAKTKRKDLPDKVKNESIQWDSFLIGIE